MNRAIFWVLLGAHVIVVVWGVVLIYRNSARYGQSDHGPALSALAPAAVFLITAMQFYRVAEDPSRTAGWIVLGIGVACSLLVTVGLLRRRHRAASGGRSG